MSASPPSLSTSDMQMSKFLNAPFGPRIRFSRPWSPSRMLLRYFTCRCSTVGGQIPSDFNSAIALAREGALSVLITLGYPADASDLRALARKRFAAATLRFGEIKVQGLATGGDRQIRGNTTSHRPGCRSHPPARNWPASQELAGTTECACPAQGRISGPSGENRGVIDRHAAAEVIISSRS